MPLFPTVLPAIRAITCGGLLAMPGFALAGAWIVLDHPDDAVLDTDAGQPADLYGSRLAMDNDTLMVGLPGVRSRAGLPQGAVRIFRRVGASWTLAQTLAPPVSQSPQSLGVALALQGDRAAVGDDRAEAVRLYQRNSNGEWLPDGVIESLPVCAGQTLDFSSGALLAGSCDEFFSRGAVYSYVNTGSGWVVTQRLQPGDVGLFHQFGAALARSGDQLFVGAPSGGGASNDGGFGPGAVYVYTLTAGLWTQSAKLLAPDASSGDGFGSALRVDDGVLFIGAPGKDAGSVDSGASYVYALQAGNWVYQSALSSPQGQDFGRALVASAQHLVVAGGVSTTGGLQTYARVGTSVSPGPAFSLPAATQPWRNLRYAKDLALADDWLAASAVDSGARLPGLVKLFQFDGSGWQERQQLQDPESARNERYGAALAASGDTVLVALPNGNLQPRDVRSGWVQVLVREQGRWTEQARLQPAPELVFASTGEQLALDGDTAVFSSAQSNGAVGRVHQFTRSGGQWTQGNDLDLGELASFPTSAIRIQHDTLVLAVASAPGTAGEQGVGAVLIFQRQAGQWQRSARINPPVAQAMSGFGAAIALDGDTLVVQQGGSAPVNRVYLRGGNGQWTLQTELPTGPNAAYTGALALEGDTLFVGSTQAGASVLQYRRNAGIWSELAPLNPSMVPADAVAGAALALSGNRLLIGAPPAATAGSADPAAGAVYLYRYNGSQWVESHRLTDTQARGVQRFGAVLAQSGDVAVIGIPTADGRVTESADAGRAYLLEGDPPFLSVPLFADGFEAP